MCADVEAFLGLSGSSLGNFSHALVSNVGVMGSRLLSRDWFFERFPFDCKSLEGRRFGTLIRPATIEEFSEESSGVELAQRHARGDERAFDEIYQRYASMVYNLSLRLTGDPERASDLHQESFLRIYRYLGRFEGRSSLKTWIYSIVLNTGRTYIKRRSRRPKTVDDERVLLTIPDRRAGPERRAIARERARRLEYAILELPPNFRVAVVLRDIEGLSYSEIAEVVGTRIGTVRSRIARGRERLRQSLEGK